MTDPLEVLQWHERRRELVYKSPAPLNMSTQEMWDWLEEMRPVIDWQAGDEYVLSGVRLVCPEISKTFGRTLKDAVCLAAAKWKRINDEI